MKKKILAVALGIISAWIFIIAGELIHHEIYPPPSNLNSENIQALTEFSNKRPITAHLLMLLIWFSSIIISHFICIKILGESHLKLNLLITTILFLGNLLNQIMIPHPTWLSLVSLGMYYPISILISKYYP